MSMLTVEECELLTDSKYRSYITQVEKALKNFEYTSEWADLISALGKLNKVLLSHLKFPVIPKKVTIGKRLAQCLHPALPSGVHLKALETYDIIFKCIGTQRLAHDLFIYSAGLFPLLGHAAMSVKPVLLTVYEKHFVALGRHIKPGLNGLLLGLLPGLEEGAEYFERTNLLLEDFCNAVGPPFFYTGIWECMLSCPSVRLCGAVYLMNHLNKRQNMEDQLHMIGLDIDLMVNAICSCLQDSSVLVQRSMLDFLLLAFPMHSGQLTRADMATILEAAVNVVLRRDMSLNRRLYAWLLGTSTTTTTATTTDSHQGRQRTESSSTTSESDAGYFQIYSKELLVAALKVKLMEEDSSNWSASDPVQAVLKPFRILISLLDKPEIGPVVIENILLSVFRRLKLERNLYLQNDPGRATGVVAPESVLPVETHKTANLLFSSFEPYFIWDFIARIFKAACDQRSAHCEANRSSQLVEWVSLSELCDLVEFLLDVIALDVYPETTTEHLPDLLRQIISALTLACDDVTDAEVTTTLKLCSKLLSRVQPSMAGQGLHRSQSMDTGDNISIFSNSDLSHNMDVVKHKGMVQNLAERNGLSQPKGNRYGCDSVATVQETSGFRVLQDGEAIDDKTKDPISNLYTANQSGSETVKETMLNCVNSELPNVEDENVEKDSPSLDNNVFKDDKNAFKEGQLVTKSYGFINGLGSCNQVTAGTESSSPSWTDSSTTSHGDVSQSLVSGVSNLSESGSDVSMQCNIQQRKTDNDPNVGVTSTSSGRLLSGHLSLMQLCIQSFQQFFHHFSLSRILKSAEFCQQCMKSIVSAAPQVGSKGVESCPTAKLLLDSQVQEVTRAFKQACRLLVDFASFPIYCTDYEVIIEQMCCNENHAELPPWLQDLLVCSCFVDCFEIQSSSISTLLDLIILTQSVQTESENKTRHRRSVSEGRISVVILPSLLPTHLVYINGRTNFYQIVAVELWRHLAEKFSVHHQRAVELFHTLHQVTPNANICEDVIGRDLIDESEVERISAFKKFSILWHLTRSIKTEPNPARNPRTFDRSMFVVLDSLKEESSITKTLALTWLTHVIQRGDTSRVLQPLLYMLLHPDTARISIQHVSVHKTKKLAVPDQDGDEDVEAKIYAISSEGGNVIYHVSQGRQAQVGKKFSQKSAEDLKSYALSVVNNKGGHSITPVRTHSVTDLSFERVNPEKVKLRINPFGSESSLDKLIFDGYDFPQSASMPNLEGVKRLNTDTCKKEGIYFDGSEMVEDHFAQDDADTIVTIVGPSPEEDKPESEREVVTQDEDMPAEDVARWILEAVISSAVRQVVGSDTPSDSEELTKSSSALGLDQSYISPSLDDLRKIDADSTSGSENGDSKHLSSASESVSFQLAGSSKVKSESSESLTMQDLELSTQQFRDPRDLDPNTDIHELHMHILLYAQQYDFRRTLYALSTLRAMLHCCPRLVVTAMATSSINSVRPPHLAKLQALLGRHRKSVFGKNFFGDLPPEVVSSYRSNMFVEIVISLCLYFVRGYYPNLMMSKLTTEELLGNRMVHILAVEILTILVSELLSIMKESGKNFVSYISDLLSRCKLQKSLLHCLLASVYNQGRNGPGNNISSNGNKASASKLTEMIIDFNENSLEPSVNDTFQMKLLQLMLVMIMLEDQILLAQGSPDSGSATAERTHLTSSLLNVHYNPHLPIIQQEMFLSAVWSALKQHHQCHLHRHWIGLVTSALPYMGRAMARTVLCVVLQLCRNLEIIATDVNKKRTSMQKVPPDHVVTMLEGLTTLCHYCLLDNTSPVSIGQPAPTTSNFSTETASAGQILSNLIHVFNPVTSGKEPSPARDSSPVSPVLDARARLLSILPRIMSCMATLWKAVQVTAEDGVAYVTSHPSAVKQHILELLSPISLPHGTNLLAAFAVAWNDRRPKSATASSSKKGLVTLVECGDQLLLVELVAAIRVLPMDTLIQTVKLAIRQPPLNELSKQKSLPLEVNLLQFFFAYVRHTSSSSQLLDSWSSLLSLLKECLQMNLSPPALFLLLQILHEFVQKTPAMEEKKNQKDLQDICQKVLEAISAIAGSFLEQTTWLRRNFAVRPGPQNEAEEEGDQHEDPEDQKDVAIERLPVLRSQDSDSKYSVQALVLLADLTAPLLDVIYNSDEKERVAPFLTILLYNVFPYLRHHSSHNLPSYRACSQMLASISGYQYTRRAWRKEAFEMFMEPSFFMMDARSIECWRVVVDNLMTHDKTTFKDLMSRVTITQTGSLNLFSSKEQEYELRSQMMKRLAFTILCSETDQYQRAMPEVQERLAECLRLPQVANVMTSVFLCFRVLILRMSPQHLTSLWPTIITEMVQVLLQIEQELSTETDEFRIAALDSSWAHLGNGLNAHNNPAWLQLYLGVCKLLDMCIILPADQVPQFQLYRWAFVGTAGEEYEYVDAGDDPTWRPHPLFMPHIIRLSRLMNNATKKRPTLLGRPHLTMSRIRSLSELQPFLYTLSHTGSRQQSQTSTSHYSQTSTEQTSSAVKPGSSTSREPSLHKSTAGQGRGPAEAAVVSNRDQIERVLVADFLELLM